MEWNRYKTYVPGEPRWTKFHDSLGDALAEVRRARRDDAQMLLISRVEPVSAQCAMPIPKSLPDSLPAI